MVSDSCERGRGVWGVLGAALLLLLGASFPRTAQTEGETMVWDGRSKWVTIQPELQNQPTEQDPVMSLARPPTPVLSGGPAGAHTVFLGLASFRDGWRCGKTIFTAFARADHPESLTVGVVDQRAKVDAVCLDEYCAMAAAEWPEHGECRYREQVRVLHMEAEDSKGPTLARARQQSLIEDEDFCLELDAHSVLLRSWDTRIIQDWVNADNEMAVLTTYIEDVEHMGADGMTHIVDDQAPHLCKAPVEPTFFRNAGASNTLNSKVPAMSPFWGAGLSFSKCHSEKRVKVNPHTAWMFDGEEFMRASHLWTFGYDMYSPSLQGLGMIHNYSRIPASVFNVQYDQEKKQRETMEGRNRFALELHRPFSGPVDAAEFGHFNFGNVRSIEQYMAFAGLSDPTSPVDRCHQLHWVPYRNPSEIEDLVPGYRMLPDVVVGAKHDGNAPQMLEKQVIRLGRGARPPQVVDAGGSAKSDYSRRDQQRRAWNPESQLGSEGQRHVNIEVETQYLHMVMLAMGLAWVSIVSLLLLLLRTHRRGRKV